MALPESGDLSALSLPRLLLELQAANFTGALKLSQNRLQKRFLLEKGAPVSSESSRASESLVAMLTASGRISSDDRLGVESRVKSEKVGEARAMLDLGLLEPKEIFDAMREQLRLRLLECFGWAGGRYALDRAASVPEDARPFRLDVLQLVQSGIEAHWSSERVISELGPRMSRHPTGTRALAKVAACLQTDDAVEALLVALDGERTLWQALQEASTPRSRAAAWLLDASGAIAYADRAASPGACGVAPAQLEIIVDGPRLANVKKGLSSVRSPEAEIERGEKAAVLQREVAEIHDRLEDLDWYALLGVDPGASPNEIKSSYLTAAKHYHPDALARLGLASDARVQANQVFAEIGTAYATLSDPERRRDYDASLRGESLGIDAEQLVNAEVLFRKGEVLMRLGNFKGALEFLVPAVDLWPEESAYQCALGWAYYKKIPSEPDKALPHLEEAATLDPEDPVVLFRLGTILRAAGQEERAAIFIARANKMDPKTSK